MNEPLTSKTESPAEASLHPSIFREYDIRGTVGQTLTEADAFCIGAAFGARVKQEKGGRGIIATGYDGRISSPALHQALAEGVKTAGHEVHCIGIGPTPALYFAVCHWNADAGVMITGSHNPPDQNGFKFMLGKKPFFGEEIQKLGDSARKFSATAARPGTEGGIFEIHDIMPYYLFALSEAFTSKRGLKVAWDAGNGATGVVMEELAGRLPGKHILLNENIDGTFPNHHPDPSVEKNLLQLIECVRDNNCDLGIAFDGDGDRIGAVDSDGRIMWPEQMMMLFARDVLEKRPGSTVIADVKVSKTLFDEIERLGGKPLMWKTGHSHIKAKMAETGAPLAGEQTGHIFFADDYYGFDDALYAAVRLLNIFAYEQDSSATIHAALPRLMATPEHRFPCDEERKFTVVEEVKERLKKEGANVCDIDGVRVTRPNGWWLLRASNTQAMLVARAEAEDAKGLESLKNELIAQLAASGVEFP